jgi:hypothetical protein
MPRRYSLDPFRAIGKRGFETAGARHGTDARAVRRDYLGLRRH